MDGVGLIGLIKEIYSYIKDKIPAFDNVYDRALRRWTNNSSLRRKFSDNALSDFKKLVGYIENSSSVNPGLLEFFELLCEEAKKDSGVASSLAAEFSVGTYRQGMDLNDKLSEIMQILRRSVGNGPDLSVAYPDVEDYIPLTVSGDETEEERIRRILAGPSEKKTLTDLIIEGKKRLILFSDPQHGKSTVLSKLAFDLQQSGIYNPFLYNLRNYSSALSLIEQIKLDQRLGNSSSSVLILDGLDELKEEQREDVVSEITGISANYPLMYIVLSCRLSHKKVMTVSGFESVYLKTMGADDLVRYVRSHSRCPDAFLVDARKSKLMRLLYVPFFLKESIGYFETHGHIPADEVTIYEYFISRSFEVDGHRKAYRTGNVTPKTKLYGHVEHMAFAMLASQRMEISPDDLAESLGMPDVVIEKLVGLSLITRGENGGLTFVHNAFKEYIVAKKLAQLTTKEIKDLICFPETDIIIPSLRNVAVLLIHLISKQESWESSEFKDWFIDRYPDILVEVGPECLDVETREVIFEKIFSSHKIKGLHIDIWYCKSLMHFAVTRRTAELLLDEIEHSESLDANLMNALRLSEYADFSLLESERRRHAEDIFLSLLEFDSSRTGDFAYLSMPLTNKSILSTELIDKALAKVNETTNCYLIQMICSMSVSVGLPDRYAEWVLAKAQHVHNYYEDGVTHVISNHDLLDFMRALRKPENILEAMSYLLPRKRDYHDSHFERDCLNLVPDMLSSLASLPDASVVDRVVEILDSSFMERLSSSMAGAFAAYLNAVTDVNDLWNKRIKELIEINHSDNKDFYAVWRMHNLLSVLLDEDRLNEIIGRDVEESFDIYHILCRLRNYAFRSPKEISIIDDFINNKVPRRPVKNSLQAQFDILFDPSEFEREIHNVFNGSERIDFEQDSDRLYLSDFNSSVLSFLQDVKGDENVIYLDDALSAFQDSEKFGVFVIDRIYHNRGESITISPIQKAHILQLVISSIQSCAEWSGLALCLINIIVEYNLSLSDDRLMDLFPWAGIYIHQKDEPGISYRSRTFIDHLYDNLQNSCLIVKGVRSVLEGEMSVYDGFHIAVATYIIRYRISELYEFIPSLIQRFEYDYERLNIIVDLLQLGNQGLKISREVLSYLSEEDKIYYYERLLLNDNKGLVLTSEDKVLALNYIREHYDTYSEHMKQKALRILFAYGCEDALDWGLEMFDGCQTWAYMDNFPTLSGYSGKSFDILAEYFRHATSGEWASTPRPQPMYESVANALKNIALESKDMLDKVQTLFRQIALEKKDFRYFNKVADELDVDYQSRNVPPPGLYEASLRYRDICA